MAESKLTKNQVALLGVIAQPVFRLDGMHLFGGREFRTARSLERRDLAHVSSEDRCRITEAGLSALRQQGGSEQ